MTPTTTGGLTPSEFASLTLKEKLKIIKERAKNLKPTPKPVSKLDSAKTVKELWQDIPFPILPPPVPPKTKPEHETP